MSSWRCLRYFDGMFNTKGRFAVRAALTIALGSNSPAEGAAQADTARALADIQTRPRIALVLGGGGARGFAHIGVLRELHEARIPVDIVVGTSMGALVGGLYASGMPLEEIERLFRSQDWPQLFDDAPPRHLTRFPQKREDRNLLVRLEVGLGGGGPRLPPGLISGGELLTLMQGYTLHTRGITDFDGLPLRFRAIATDVSTGERVVLDRGSLGLALRASMSVPGVFAPVEIRGRQLIDGGIVDNLPIEAARDLGADVVIAVDVGSTLEDAPRETALGFADRAMTIMIRRTSPEEIASLTVNDWLIVPDLKGIRSGGFTSSNHDRAVAAGRAAVAASPGRRPLAMGDREFEEWDRNRTALWRSAREIDLAFVRADASNTTLAPDVVARLFPNEMGARLDSEAFVYGMNRVLAYGGFSDASVDFVEEQGAEGIELRPTDKSWGPSLIRSGIVLTDRQRGRSLWSLRAHLVNGRLNAWGGQLFGRVHLGSDQLLEGEWYQPLHPAQRFFGSLLAGIGRQDQIVGRADGGEESLNIEELRLEVGGGLRLGAWGETRFGLQLSHLDAVRPSGGGSALPDAASLTSWFTRFEADLLDRVSFPSRGILLRSELLLAREFLWGEENFERLRADALLAISQGRHTVLVGGEVGTALGDTVRVGRDFQLGGLFRLTAADRGSLRGSYAGLGRLIYYLRPGAPARQAEGSPFRFGFSLEAGQTWSASEDIDLDDLLFGATLFGAVDTPIGPIHAGWAWLDERSPTWFFAVGPTF